MKHCFLTLGMVAITWAAGAAERVALVIGNNAYHELPSHMQLASPRNDAQDVSAALQKLGYVLVNDGPVMDASRDTIMSSTARFIALARNAEAAVF